MIEFEDKSFDQSYSAAKDKNKVSDYTNPVEILKLRLNKIIATNKEKKKLMDQYIRNVRVIEDAFEQIKEASGINNIQEIVTTFIKAEEQNHSLFNYVNMLNTETDALEESNKEIKDQIMKIKERGDLNEQEKRNLKIALEQEIEMIEQEIERGNIEYQEVKTTFAKAQEYVEKMVRMFKQSRFFLSVAQKMSYDEGFVFTENNIIQYLAELEEYISSLITYTAFKRDEPNAAVSAIPLETLNQKEYSKKDMAIDPYVDAHWNQDAAQPGNASDPLQTDIINSRDLYKNFMKMVEQKQIDFIRRPAGQQQNQSAFPKRDDD